MWVAVCNFDDESVEFEYNQYENQIEDTFSKRMTTVDDLITSTIFGINKGYIKIEDLEERVNSYKKSKNDQRTIFESVSKELGNAIDQHKTVTRPEIFNGYRNKTKEELNFVASIDIGDNIVNNSRLLAGVGEVILSGKDIKVGIKIKDTKNLGELDYERERLQKEMGSKFLCNFANSILEVGGYSITNNNKNKIGKVFLTFPQQYDTDTWKYDIEVENVT